MSERIAFVSGNQNKAEQVQRYLHLPVDHVSCNIPEIQSLDSREVALHKANEAFRQLQIPVLVDDSSLVFLAFGKLPGPYIGDFLEEIGVEKLCRQLDIYPDRSAVATAAMALHNGKEVIVFDASISGRIAENPRGKYGYGWDTIFIPDGHKKTRGEMPDGEKERDETSVRKKVIEKVATHLVHSNCSSKL